QRRLSTLFREKLRRFVDAGADVVRDRADQEAKEKRHTPTPALELFGGQPGIEASAEAGGQDGGQALAGDLPAGKEAAAVRAVLGQKGGGAAELSACGKALNHARDHNADGRPDTDRG